MFIDQAEMLQKQKQRDDQCDGRNHARGQYPEVEALLKLISSEARQGVGSQRSYSQRQQDGAPDDGQAIQQISRLRLVVAVPEEQIGGIVHGAKAEFQVPAYPERNYSGTIARASHALDKATRTMAVELDVLNGDGSLSPGMYPTVKWPMKRSRPALLVPRTSVVTTTERTFVVRNLNGSAQWVEVRKGGAEGDLLEVMGDLKKGDMVIRHATDEMREGSPIKTSPK